METIMACALTFILLGAQSDSQEIKVDVPKRWRSEAVNLPPPFAPKVKLKGKANVYFSPGWGDKQSEEFFTYIFLFQTGGEQSFDKQLIEREVLAYFGGLASRVSVGDISPESFKLDVQEVTKEDSNGQRYRGTLRWTEPFFTKAEQVLNLEMDAYSEKGDGKNYLLACVCPKDPNAKKGEDLEVWQRLRKIRDKFNRQRVALK